MRNGDENENDKKLTREAVITEKKIRKGTRQAENKQRKKY